MIYSQAVALEYSLLASKDPDIIAFFDYQENSGSLNSLLGYLLAVITTMVEKVVRLASNRGEALS